MEQTAIPEMTRNDFKHMTRNDFKNMTRNDFKHMRRRKLPDINAFETRIYNAMHGLLVKQTRDICEKSGLPYAELRAEADFIFCRTLRRYRDERGVKFSTFLCLRSVQCTLFCFCRLCPAPAKIPYDCSNKLG